MKDTTRQRALDSLREATGCTVDEAESTLTETNWDVNEAVVRIIESESCGCSLCVSVVGKVTVVLHLPTRRLLAAQIPSQPSKARSRRRKRYVQLPTQLFAWSAGL